MQYSTSNMPSSWPRYPPFVHEYATHAWGSKRLRRKDRKVNNSAAGAVFETRNCHFLSLQQSITFSSSLPLSFSSLLSPRLTEAWEFCLVCTNKEAVKDKALALRSCMAHC